MMAKEWIEKAICFVKERFAKDASGHDAEHTFRVYRLAMKLNEKENGDPEIVALSSLLHDVDDRKLFDPSEEAAKRFLESLGVPEGEKQAILKNIEEVSFKGSDSKTPDTIEGKIVQDADRLDALGAIGVARSFAYGGAHHRKLYDPKEPPILHMDDEAYKKHESTTINHFYEKLLLLEGMMNTEEGKRRAKKRSEYLKSFLEEFLEEWEGKR